MTFYVFKSLSCVCTVPSPYLLLTYSLPTPYILLIYSFLYIRRRSGVGKVLYRSGYKVDRWLKLQANKSKKHLFPDIDIHFQGLYTEK